jgi:hypothetical protein
MRKIILPDVIFQAFFYLNIYYLYKFCIMSQSGAYFKLKVYMCHTVEIKMEVSWMCSKL